jgi:hypothetical protein
MTASAWIFMIIVNTIIVAATAYGFYRLLTSERQLDSHD